MPTERKMTANIRRAAESAVKAMQLYMGSQNYGNVRDGQRLYASLQRRVTNLIKLSGNDPQNVWDQVTEAAKHRGAIKPIPGQHI